MKMRKDEFDKLSSDMDKILDVGMGKSENIKQGGIQMDNRQAVGYMLMACKELGLSKEDAKKLYGEMHYQFDINTPDEAEEKGFKWYYEE